jgi:DNA-binding SARP family transcriptional activator
VEFRILGPLEVTRGRGGVSVKTPKLRALLAVLLLHPNEVVSSERLIDELWGERPPATAPKLVQIYVSRLRRELGLDAIETRAPGYLLPVGEDDLDAARFRRLAGEGRRLATGDEPEPARRVFREALGLWRGPPLADVPFESFARNEVERLEEERMTALLDLIDCELALGRHAEVVPELEALVGQDPLRERPRAQLIVALYRSGRQADALALYRDARRTLVEELGLEPGRELRDLEKAILTQDPGLEAPPKRSAAQRPRLLRRLTRPVAAAVVVAVGLTLAALVVAVALSRRTDASIQLAPNHVGFIDAKSGRVTKSFQVGRGPQALTLAYDSVWVANYRETTVTRIGRADGRSVTIPVGGHPTGLTADRGTIWVWTLEGLLVPIDPRYNRAGNSIPLASKIVGAQSTSGKITSGAGYLWIAAPPATLIRVDAANPRNSPLRILPDEGVQGAITYHGGNVWVAGADQVFPITAETANPDTGATVGVVRDLAFGTRSLWVISGGPGHVGGVAQALRRVDPHTGLGQATIAVGSDPVSVAIAGGSIWIAERTDGAVERVDAAQGRVVETISLGAKPTALASDRTGVWVAVR